MTIYRLYAENGHRAGFWIQHRTWENHCARVERVAGLESGTLPGNAPLHGQAAVQVIEYDVRSGRPLSSPRPLDPPHDKHYTRIAEPPWFHPPTHFFREAHGERAAAR